MKKYEKIIILSSVLVVLITLIVLVMIYDVSFPFFKSLSVDGIKTLKTNVNTLIMQEATEVTNNKSAKDKLNLAKNNFDVAKNEYESIDESTIEIVQEATKQEDYFIEYLWVVLGNYSRANGLSIHILTPGSSFTENATTENNENAKEDAKQETSGTTGSTTSELSAINNGIKIVVEGRYANLADFVFDVENDKELSFKLDNIKMSYAGDNKVQAIFDVLNLSVKK